MKGLIVVGAICMQMSWGYGYPGGQQGVGAFAYQDSAGNRYGGTYGLKDGQVYNTRGDSFQDLPFGLPTFPGFQEFPDADDFFPEYFRNFENLLQEAFGNHLDHQRTALNAAKKAYDLTSNQEAYIPNFNYNRFGRLPGYNNFAMPRFGENSAYASAAAGPGFTHQIASISPGNPAMQNIDVTSFGDAADPGQKYYSVSSKSYSSSSDFNGQKKSNRGSETTVNNNGKVTSYKVHS